MFSFLEVVISFAFGVILVLGLLVAYFNRQMRLAADGPAEKRVSGMRLLLRLPNWLLDGRGKVFFILYIFSGEFLDSGWDEATAKEFISFVRDVLGKSDLSNADRLLLIAGSLEMLLGEDEEEENQE